MTPAERAELEQCLAQQRLASYGPPFARPGPGEKQRDAALRLYEWNLRAAGALFPLMHLFEVTLRNAVHSALVQSYGRNWPRHGGFTRSLANPPAPAYSPRRDLQKVRSRETTTGKVIPELKFVFWENMLTGRHDGALWEPHLHRTFPNLPLTPLSVASHRNELRERVERVRRVRNRIAHHEPIIDDTRFDLPRMLDEIGDVLAWRSRAMHAWMVHLDTARAVLDDRPRA